MKCVHSAIRHVRVIALLIVVIAGPATAVGYKAGLAKAVVTPTEPAWLGGYGSRTQPADGKIHDLFAKALAIQDDSGYAVVLITLDTENVPRAFADSIAARLEAAHHLAREQIVITCSHTHCGPALAGADARILYPMSAEQYAVTERYTQRLADRAVQLAGEALSRLEPAELAYGKSTCGFGVNRRTNKEAATSAPEFRPAGPVDHDVPVMTVQSGGELKAVLLSYACHCTTMAFQQWCGDWAGFAMLEIESAHPGATAMFVVGCGADTNPLPRRKLELCRKYGHELASSVETVIGGPRRPLPGPLRAAMRRVDLAFGQIPSRTELEETARTAKRDVDKRWARYLFEQIAEKGSLPKSYTYAVQGINFGNDLFMVVLSGEVVMDYSLRLKRELGGDRTWVAAYANDVCAYMPSERVLKEGGYEGRDSMVYYGLPSAWAPGLEDKIIGAVHQLAADCGLPAKGGRP